MLNIYESWRREAVYSPRKTARSSNVNVLSSSNFEGTGSKILHGQWCARNYINGRAIVKAYEVRQQLVTICTGSGKIGLNIDVSLSCGKEMVSFLKCVCAGLFLQSATRIPSTNKANNRQGNSGKLFPSRSCYKTKVGNTITQIHPTSTLFGRNPLPKSIIYT